MYRGNNFPFVVVCKENDRRRLIFFSPQMSIFRLLYIVLR